MVTRFVDLLTDEQTVKNYRLAPLVKGKSLKKNANIHILNISKTLSKDLATSQLFAQKNGPKCKHTPQYTMRICFY